MFVQTAIVSCNAMIQFPTGELVEETTHSQHLVEEARENPLLVLSRKYLFMPLHTAKERQYICKCIEVILLHIVLYSNNPVCDPTPSYFHWKLHYILFTVIWHLTHDKGSLFRATYGLLCPISNN